MKVIEIVFIEYGLWVGWGGVGWGLPAEKGYFGHHCCRAAADQV
jgi:hypothetical protein